MYVRSSEFRGDPARIDDGLRYVREEVFPTITKMDGCVGMSMLVDRETGRCVATTAWQSEDAMRASADKVRPLRDRAERDLGASGSEIHQWEVAVVHRDHAAPDGACARLTWVSGDPSTIDRLVDVYRMVILPQIQEWDGFCSASLMVDRDGGRAVGTAAFDSRRALEATRDAAARLRERVANEAGTMIDDVEEMEIAFAHLHVPEMA